MRYQIRNAADKKEVENGIKAFHVYLDEFKFPEERRNMPEDKELTCSDCGTTFMFTAKEQDFYKSKQLSDPKRCKACRDKRKQEQPNRERGNFRDDRRNRR